MASIGFVTHGQRKRSVALAEETARWLRSEGHHTEFLDAASPKPAPRAAAPVSTPGGRADGSALIRAEEIQVAPGATDPGDVGAPGNVGQLDLAVSLGGDGTMLRTVDLVSPHGIPVLGVNLGHLGYLAAVEPEALQDALRRFLAGEYQIESRLTLDISMTDDAGDGNKAVLHRSALNDLVLQRVTGGHTVHTEVCVNGDPFLTFAADSLIVATPTGSTAYNLSARGPIVSPRARVQVLTPVAPHMLFDRSLVLDADDTLSLSPIGGQPADVVIDGWLAATIEPGQTLHCRKGDRDALLVTFGERDFHRILKRKFNLADR